MKVMKNSNHKKRVMAASELPEGTVILVQSNAYVEVSEDDYEQGVGRNVNTWEFDVSGQYSSAQELVDAIAAKSYCFSNKLEDYYFMDDHLTTSAEVDDDNLPVDDRDFDAFKSGEVNWYIADMYLQLTVVSEPHEMTPDEAESFGFNLY